MNRKIIKTEELNNAVIEIRGELLDAVDRLEEPAEPMSDDFERVMPRRIKSHRAHSTWTVALKRVAIVILVLGISFSSAMVFSEPARAAVYGWFRSITDGRVDYWFQYPGTTVTLPDVELGYMPEGYEEVKRETDEELGEIRIDLYNSMHDDYIWICVSLLSKTDVISYSGESPRSSTVDINGIQADYFQDPAGVMNNIIWVDDSKGIVVMIDSALEKDEIVKLSKELKMY